MGTFHAQALERGHAFSLVGVVDPSEPRWAHPAWEPNLERALGNLRPDAVIVAAPPQAHAHLARLCLEADCHVLLEKPICPDPQEARKLAEEFRQRGRVLFGGHSERFHPVFTRLREELGQRPEWRSLRSLRQGPPPAPLRDGGAILDLAIHDLDLALRLFGDLSLAKVCTDGSGLVTAHLERPEGSATISAGYHPERKRTWELETDDGTWHADFLGRALEWQPRFGARRFLEISHSDALEEEHARFLEACRGGDWWCDLQPQIRAVELGQQIRTGSPNPKG